MCVFFKGSIRDSYMASYYAFQHGSRQCIHGRRLISTFYPSTAYVDNHWGKIFRNALTFKSNPVNSQAQSGTRSNIFSNTIKFKFSKSEMTWTLHVVIPCPYLTCYGCVMFMMRQGGWLREMLSGAACVLLRSTVDNAPSSLSPPHYPSTGPPVGAPKDGERFIQWGVR